jgi:hypothetical protein
MVFFLGPQERVSAKEKRESGGKEREREREREREIERIIE